MMNGILNKIKPVLLITAVWTLGNPAEAGSLLDLYHKALESNPTLLTRKYTIDQSQAREDQAFSGLLPQVSANGSYSLNSFKNEGDFAALNPDANSRQNYDGLRGTVQARQALFDLPAYLRYEGAEAATRQSKEEFEAYQMELGGELIDRYLQTLEAIDQITYLADEMESVSTQVKRLQHLYKKQMTKVTDLYEVEAYYQSLQTQNIEAENQKAIALEKLRQIAGILPEQVSLLAVDSFPPKPTDVDSWISDAVTSNLNLLALKAGIESAEKNLSGAKAGHLPQLALIMSHTYSDQGFDNRSQPPYNVSSANLQLNIPLFEGGGTEAAAREAAARLLIVKQEHERVRRQVELETRTSFLNAIASHSKIDSTAEEVKFQKKANEAQKKGYELGASTIIDVLDSQRRASQAQLDHLKARYDYIRNLIALKIWSGGLSIDKIEEIDVWFTRYSPD
jgi:outer membrane protein